VFITRSQLRVLAIVSALNLSVPHAVLAEMSPKAPPRIDVALTAEGHLSGVLVDNSGRPVADVEIGLIRGSELVNLATTNRQGCFTIECVQGGTYQLAAMGTVQIVRAWTSRTAPPVARPAAVFVVEGDIIRGQQACGCASGVGCCDSIGCDGTSARPGFPRRAHPHRRQLVRWMRANPGVVLTGIAAAIAVPIAFIASDDDAS
jgi:hypothetical protein